MPLRTFNPFTLQRWMTLKTPTTTKRSDVTLTVYNGTKILQYGTITMPCKYDGHWQDTTFYVAQTQGSVIFGLATCTDLGLVQMHCSVESNHSLQK